MNDIAYDEWMAWRKIVAELRLQGININNQDNLTKALKEWGERYADWRNEREALYKQA